MLGLAGFGSFDPTLARIGKSGSNWGYLYHNLYIPSKKYGYESRTFFRFLGIVWGRFANRCPERVVRELAFFEIIHAFFEVFSCSTNKQRKRAKLSMLVLGKHL